MTVYQHGPQCTCKFCQDVYQHGPVISRGALRWGIAAIVALVILIIWAWPR